MFDRKDIHIHPVGAQHHTHNHLTTIHEHRAPTDDSLRLLQEMRDRLQQEYVCGGDLNTNLGKIQFGFWRNMARGPAAYDLAINWRVNGVDYPFKKTYHIPVNTVLESWFVVTVQSAVQEFVANIVLLGNANQFEETLRNTLFTQRS